jgi:hypothetical protein
MSRATESNYIFQGRLCGYLCAECLEPLSKVKVRLYRSRKGQDVTSLAVADAKETFAILTDSALKAKESSLIAETETNEDGSFTFQLGAAQKYSGEAFEIDVYCGTVPHRRVGPNPPPPVQFSITTIQPRWKQTDAGFIAGWEYCLPYRNWCAVRLRFGAWVICGKVTTCDQRTPLPVAGVKVRAFDTDWLQDDELGSDFTDGAGNFHIYYTTDDFQKTPFSPLINFECVSGPDLYFIVEAADGTPLLVESSSRGRAPDRQNVGNCFCVNLCVDPGDAPPPPFNNPIFTHVGDFDWRTEIDSAAAGTGLTTTAVASHGGPDFGFFGYLKLKAFCPKKNPGGAHEPMRYRFLYVHPTNPGVEVPITGALVQPVNIGTRYIIWDFGLGSVYYPQTIRLKGSGATPDPTPHPVVPPGTSWGPVPTHVVVPDADGWVIVDQNAIDDGFHDFLMRFDSTGAVAGGGAPGNGAGNNVVSKKNGVKIKLIFEAKPVSSGGPATFRDELPVIYINNWSEVSLLDITQFHGGGADSCTPLDASLDIQYTTDHELMASWGLSISTAASVVIPVLPGGTGPRGGFGTEHLNISTWPPCSYTVSLGTRRSLTDGENDDPGRSVNMTFCIEH